MSTVITLSVEENGKKAAIVHISTLHGMRAL